MKIISEEQIEEIRINLRLRRIIEVFKILNNLEDLKEKDGDRKPNSN